MLDIVINENILKCYSLVGITCGPVTTDSKFLLYYDEKLNCWSFPSYGAVKKNNIGYVVNQVQSQFGLEVFDSLRYLYRGINYKYSEEEKRALPYDCIIYLCKLKEQIHTEEKNYRCMSVTEMQNDEQIRNVNSDIISMLRAGIDLYIRIKL